MKIGSDEIFYMNTFNSATRVVARDVVVQGNNIVFLVKGRDVGKAIGKNASNVKALKEKLRKNVEILGYTENVGEFFKKALYTVKVKGVELKGEGKKKAIVLLEAGEKRKVLTAMGKFKRIKEIAQRNYGLEEVRLK